MRREKALRSIGVLVGLAALAWGSQAAARQNVFIGGITTDYTYWEREYDDDSTGGNEDNSGDRRDFSIGPDFEFQSVDQHNALLVHYAPALLYDDLASETDIDHAFDLDWQHQLSRQWSYQVTDFFTYSSDPTQDAAPFFETPPGEETIGAVDPGNELSDNFGTRRYWTNRLALLTTYDYGPESSYDLGYTYRILRDDSSNSGDQARLDDYDEYDRHGLSFTWANRYTPTWRSQLDLNYALGDFKDPGVDGLSRDLDEYRVDLGVDYTKSTTTFFPAVYSYQRVDYQDLRDDVWGHELQFGWDHTFDARNHLIVGAGPSYVDSDRLDGELGFNFLINYMRAYQHGSFDAVVEKRYLSREFTGGDDTGFTDATDVRVSASYQMTRDLLFDVFAFYRYEEILNPEGAYRDAALGGLDPALEDDIGDVTYSRDIYSAGITASYSVLRWLTASLSYVYYDQEGDVAEDAYYDHRIVARLTASTELWRQ